MSHPADLDSFEKDLNSAVTQAEFENIEAHLCLYLGMDYRRGYRSKADTLAACRRFGLSPKWAGLVPDSIMERYEVEADYQKFLTYNTREEANKSALECAREAGYGIQVRDKMSHMHQPSFWLVSPDGTTTITYRRRWRSHGRHC